MVAAKVFLLTVHIHVHNVYCRGARPRAWGPIRLLAVTAHSSASTRPLLPAFPLLVKEDLLFRQVIQCGNDLRALEQHLKKESLKIQLVQEPNDLLLAQLTTSLARVLFPRYPLKWLREGVEMELLMTPTVRFQSAVGPRVEISTRLIIEYCPEEKVKVVDLTPAAKCTCFNSCSCCNQAAPCHCQTNTHDHWARAETPANICRHGASTNNCNNSPHDCDICQTYDMVVRRRFSCSSASPWVRKPL